MQEFLTAYESLEAMVDLQGRLEQATTLEDVLTAVQEAVGNLRCMGAREDHGSVENTLDLHRSDTLVAIQERMATVHREIVLPAEYRLRWEVAIQELDEKMGNAAAELAMLHSLPHATEKERWAFVQYPDDYGLDAMRQTALLGDAEFDKCVRDEATFTALLQRIEVDITEPLAKLRATKERLSAYAPAGLRGTPAVQ